MLILPRRKFLKGAAAVAAVAALGRDSRARSLRGRPLPNLWTWPNLVDLYGNTWVKGAQWTGQQNGQWKAGAAIYPPNGTTYPPVGILGLLTQWPNPNTGDGSYPYNPTFNAGAFTGFTPSNPNGHSQMGCLASGSTTTLQAEGGTFGCYLIGDEFGAAGRTTAQNTGQLNFPLNMPLFASPTSVLTVSMDLQIPFAVNQPYAKMNLGFTGPGGTYFEFVYTIRYAIIGTAAPGVTVSGGGVGLENAYQLIMSLGSASANPYITTISGNYSSVVWSGFQTLAFSISAAQFQAALNFMAGQTFTGGNPFIGNTNPALYTAQQIHLNAEIITSTAGTIMGWSAKNFTGVLGG